MTKTLQKQIRFVLEPAVLGAHVLVGIFARLGWVMVMGGLAGATAQAAQPQVAVNVPNVAFYYQAPLPLDELQAFDVVVVDPKRVELPDSTLAPRTAIFARLALAGWQRSAPDADAYRNAVLSSVTVLWKQGYRGFLLDDGVGLDQSDASDHNMLALIDAIHAQHPDARLMLRNHIAVARERSDILYGLVLESLYWRPGGFAGTLAQTPAALRDRILQEVKQLHAALPVIALDYCRPEDKVCRRQLAAGPVSEAVQPTAADRLCLLVCSNQAR